MNIDASKEKLAKLFLEMLDYKNKKYEKNMKFEDLLDLVSIHYNYYKYEFNEVYCAIRYRERYIPYSEVDNPFLDDEDIDNALTDDKINEILEEVYSELSDEDYGYKKYANYFIDINLKEGQSLKSLFDECEHKLISLFYEMLEFIGKKYEKEKYDTYYNLGIKVANEYPWYYQDIENLNRVHLDMDSNYIDYIDRMEKLYSIIYKYKEEYPSFAKKYKEEIEAHKVWKEEVKKKRIINSEIEEKRIKDPLYTEIKKFRKIARQKMREVNRKETEKYKKMLNEKKDELNRKYPLEEYGEDPYQKIISEQTVYDSFMEINEYDDDIIY